MKDINAFFATGDYESLFNRYGVTLFVFSRRSWKENEERVMAIFPADLYRLVLQNDLYIAVERTAASGTALIMNRPKPATVLASKP